MDEQIKEDVKRAVASRSASKSATKPRRDFEGFAETHALNDFEDKAHKP